MDSLRQHRVQISRLCLVVSCIVLGLGIWGHISSFYLHQVNVPNLRIFFSMPGFIFLPTWLLIAYWAGPSGWAPAWYQRIGSRLTLGWLIYFVGILFNIGNLH